MDQPPLIVESLNEALSFTARAIGFNEIALELWPAKGAKEAARYLHDCLNPERPHKLSGEEILHIARRGREKGCYLVTSFVCSDTGFAPPVPLEPEAQMAELQRAYIESVRVQRTIADRLEKIQRAR